MSTARVIRFCPYCGASIETRFLYGAERAACPACGWIHFEDPKVAAGVLVEEGESVLLVRRINEPMIGYWSFPAGFVNAREDPAEAAQRVARWSALLARYHDAIDAVVAWGRYGELLRYDAATAELFCGADPAALPASVAAS